MSIFAHKTGLIETTGKTGAGIVTSNLIGNFDPSTGINTSYWDNQVGGGKNLRRYNGITHNNSAPHNFQFDGSNDYLGEASSSYGGDPFEWDIGGAYTCCGWFKHNNAVHYPFAMKNDTNNRWYTQIQSDEDVRLWVEASGTDTFTTKSDFRSLISNSTWYYFAVSHDGSGNWKVYLNGSFLFKGSAVRDPSGTAALEIGRRNVSSASYSGSGVKIGKQHIYSALLNDSQIRQNFLASHDIYDARIYGATYTA